MGHQGVGVRRGPLVWGHHVVKPLFQYCKPKTVFKFKLSTDNQLSFLLFFLWLVLNP